MKNMLLSLLLLFAVSITKAQMSNLIPRFKPPVSNKNNTTAGEGTIRNAPKQIKTQRVTVTPFEYTIGDSTKTAKRITQIPLNVFTYQYDSSKEIIEFSTFEAEGTSQTKEPPSPGNSENLPLIRIGGLGSLSNSTSKVDVDPSANINIEFALPMPRHPQLNRNIRVYLSYNIGNSLDSSAIDSIKLGSFFFPDKSKNGFAGGVTLDIARLIKNINSLENPNIIEEGKKYSFYTLEPYVEYAYLIRNIKDPGTDLPRIESNTWLLGVKASLQYLINDNNFAIILNGYRKWLTFSDATYPTYNNIFKKSNADQVMPQKNALWGVNVGMQLNKALLGFTYERLTSKGIVNKDIASGTFILKATLSADFLEFR